MIECWTAGMEKKRQKIISLFFINYGLINQSSSLKAKFRFLLKTFSVFTLNVVWDLNMVAFYSQWLPD